MLSSTFPSSQPSGEGQVLPAPRPVRPPDKSKLYLGRSNYGRLIRPHRSQLVSSTSSVRISIPCLFRCTRMTAATMPPSPLAFPQFSNPRVRPKRLESLYQRLSSHQRCRQETHHARDQYHFLPLFRRCFGILYCWYLPHRPSSPRRSISMSQILHNDAVGQTCNLSPLSPNGNGDLLSMDDHTPIPIRVEHQQSDVRGMQPGHGPTSKRQQHLHPRLPDLQ